VVLIPAFNEEKTIAKVIVQAKKYADEIIVVDDGSTDSTAMIAEALGATLIRHRSNMGKGAALRSLVEEARKREAAVFITMDADGQHDPKEIPSIAEPVLKGEADIVIGMREMTAGSAPRERIVGNRVLDAIISVKAGRNIKDTQSGFRAYSAKALHTIDFKQEGMAVETQTLIDAANAGLRIVEVPVSTTYEGIKARRNPAMHFSSILDYILSRTVVDSPLLYLGLPGLVSVLLGVVAGLIVIDTFFRTRLIAIGTALISAILIIIGIVALATALILKFLKVQLGK
jgi:glycosyltransferase involved in cell wall biosynthesis